MATSACFALSCTALQRCSRRHPEQSSGQHISRQSPFRPAQHRRRSRPLPLVAAAAPRPTDSGHAAPSYYQLLGVPPTASLPEIKQAYRRLALKLHPDVSDDEDADHRFAEVAQAYDVLSDAQSRRLYDQFGAEGMKRHSGAAAGTGNASRAWDEFKPTKKKQSGRSRARAAAATAAQQQHGAAAPPPGAEAGAGAEPQAGDVVEYPLSELASAAAACALACARDVLAWAVCRASALLRCGGDVARLPPDVLPLRFDVWELDPATLSEGCGGPELPEEVMV
eukprot:scaffold5.g829.t1